MKPSKGRIQDRSREEYIRDIFSMISQPQERTAQKVSADTATTAQQAPQSTHRPDESQDNNMLVTWPSRTNASSSASVSYASSSRGSTTQTENTDTSQMDWSDRSGTKQAETPKASRPTSKARFWSHVKGWMTTSEPSTQALRDHKKTTFKKAGISMDDPRASARLHLPAGEIPQDAIRATGPGPDPEEVVEKKKRERQQMREALSGQGNGTGCGHHRGHSRSHSHSTCSMTGSGGSSVRGGSSRYEAPWEHQGSSGRRGSKSNSG